MIIRTAENIGFCFGVKRAIQMAWEARERAGMVYTLGDIIHNEQVVEQLKVQGIRPVHSIDEVGPGDTLIIRSHGVGRETYENCREMGVALLDATCPFVKRIHSIAREFSEKGIPVIIIGKDDHPEVMGINGWCGGKAVIVGGAKDVESLGEFDRACIVVQTTFSKTLYRELAAALEKKVQKPEFFDTICATTSIRQAEAEKLSRECTHMIIIGGRNSSNTRKLYEACRNFCTNIQTIQKPDDLALEIIHSNDIIGIVAGASTPDWMIREVKARMSEIEKTMAEHPEVENNEVETEATATVDEPIAVEPEPADKSPELVDESPEPARESIEPADDNSEAADSNFEEAFEKTLVRIRNGQILKGTVVQLVDGEVSVNIGYKSDGFIPRNEFSSDTDLNPADVVKIGDEIEVEVLKVNDGEGNVLLSRKNVESKKAWDKLVQETGEEGRIFDGIGKEVVKGGMIASINGIRAFVPASQLSNKYVENISDFVGKPIRLKIIEVDKSRKRIVASHKAVLQEEAEQARKEKWDQLVVGSKISGVVRRLTDFGAFVDIGGLDGLIHVTDVAWGRVKHPSDVLKSGQEIEVLILNVDKEKQRISLGYKQLQPKPWTLAGEKYPIGTIIEGKVVRIVPFGAFVAIEPTIDGLIHISQVGVRRVVKVEDEIKVGDMVRCKVLDVNPEAKRISLSRRDVLIEENPEIAEELAKEKADRDRIAAERAEQRAAAMEQAKQQREQHDRERVERRERPSQHSADRPERQERRQRREDSDYQLPPVQSSTTSLADLFSNFTPEE